MPYLLAAVWRNGNFDELNRIEFIFELEDMSISWATDDDDTDGGAAQQQTDE